VRRGGTHRQPAGSRHSCRGSAEHEWHVSRRRADRDARRTAARCGAPHRRHHYKALHGSVPGAIDAHSQLTRDRCRGLRHNRRPNRRWAIRAVRPGPAGARQTSIDVVARARRGTERLLAPSDFEGTSTIVFSDIESSTERSTSLGDTAWMRVLNRQNEVVRRNVRRWQGTRSRINAMASC